MSRPISRDLLSRYGGAFNQDRTGDLILTMDALYLLSYKGILLASEARHTVCHL